MGLIVLKAADHLPFFRRPSEAQLAAGNYHKPKLTFQGLPISIENPQGTMRAGSGSDGDWATGMQHHYGYIRGTLGVDGDHFDCFVGPQVDATHAYVVTTMAPPDFEREDEQKAMLGFPNEDAAVAAFQAHYDDPRFIGGVTAMPMGEFKAKVRTTRENPRMIKSVVFLKGADGKLSTSMRKKIGAVGSKHRQEMPADAFLLGAERKFPVKVERDGAWHYSPELLEAAARRARMEGRTDLAARADKIRASL